jgi:hypothetical protein
MDASMNTNNLSATPLNTVKKPLVNTLQKQHAQYLSYYTFGNDYFERMYKLHSRNVIYISACKTLTIRQVIYFYDLFRGKSKPAYMPFVNFINAFEIDASLIFNHDLISEAIISDTLLPGFNPETYRISSDIW